MPKLNKPLRTLLVAAPVFLVVYLLFAFTKWSINPGDWPEGARAFAAFTSTFISIAVVGAYWSAP